MKEEIILFSFQIPVKLKSELMASAAEADMTAAAYLRVAVKEKMKRDKL